MRSWMLPVLAALVAAAITTGIAAGSRLDGGNNGHANDGRGDTYAIGLWGDLPYSDVQAPVGVPNLIADMNSQDLAFTAHDGDLKAGNGTPGSTTPTTCADALYTQALGYFNSLKAPAVFTPGDNDWTDCDRPSNGGFNSLERLDHERQAVLQHAVHARPAPDAPGGADDAALPRRERAGPVRREPPLDDRPRHLRDAEHPGLVQQPLRHQPRPGRGSGTQRRRHRVDAADVRRGDGAQAPSRSCSSRRPIQGGTRPTAHALPSAIPNTLAETDGQPDGYQSFLLALRTEVIAFGKPVAYVHGDSHYFRIDKPFLDSAGQRLENFTRVETFGDHQENGTNDVNWLKVTVDPSSREVFSYQPQIVPANKVVPSP